MTQEALVTHGCTKAETAVAEQLLVKLQEEEAESALAVAGSADMGQRAAQILKSGIANARAGPSLRDAAATQDGAELLSSINTAGSGGLSARDGSAGSRTAAVSAAATPRVVQTNQLLDFSMFEQLWLSDLSSLPSK